MGCLDAKTALVTGGSRGIGAAIVRRLAAEGVHVAFAYRDSEEAAATLLAEIGAAGGAATAIRADLAGAAGVEAMFAAVDDTFGAAPNIDILVNNAGAGSNGRDASLKGSSEALFDTMMAVNAKAPFLVTQGALPRLRAHGRIINIGSVSGRLAQHFAAGYAMSKRALQSLTLSTAVEVAPRGITCNLIAPGAVATDFIAALRGRPGFDEATARMTPMGRMGEADDIAGAVLMLCRDEASWVTGNIIEAAGGLAL